MTIDIEPYSMVQPLLAASSGIAQWPGWPETGGFLVVCTFFLLLNAFFVASEFAIVKVRPSQIDMIAVVNPAKAAWARRVVDNLDSYLSANQLGITLASLGLAIFAEPYIDQLLTAIFVLGFNDWFGISWFTEGTGYRLLSNSSHVVTLAFFTIFHVVLGELIPKGIAIRKSLEVTLMLAPPLHIFYVTLRPIIVVLNGAANFCLKNVFRIDPVKDGEYAHSAEELALLVEESGENFVVTDKEREILINALTLNDVHVKDVMTPKSEIVTLDIKLDFAENLQVAGDSKHTRFILIDSHIDNALGFIHVKDILTIIGKEDQDLLKIRHEVETVPDSMPLDSLLKLFQVKHERLAMVANEFGEVSGIVFMDNIIEELVGDIQDEFDDDKSGEFSQISDTEFVVEGTLSLNSLGDYVPELNALHGGEMSTIGGYITQRLERFPQSGEVIQIEEFEVEILTIEARKVGRLHFRKLSHEVADLIHGGGIA